MTIQNEELRYEQLFRVTAKFHSSMEIDDVLAEVIHTLRDVYPSFTYYLLLAHDNKAYDAIPIKDLQFETGVNTAAMQAFVTGKIQIKDSIKEKQSIMYAPLKGKQGVYGVLEIIAPNSMMFPKSEIRFIELLANTAGNAFENAQLYQQSKQLVADLQLINETSHRLNSNLRLTETMTFMSEQIIKSFEASEVGFIVVNSQGDTEVLPGSTEFFEDEQSGEYLEFCITKIMKQKEPIFIGDLQTEMSFTQTIYKSIMAVPMVQRDEIIGFAIVLQKKPYFFSFDKFKLLQSLIHHSSLAFTNSILREELETLVITDYLTKLYSRNHLDNMVQKSMEDDAYGTFILIDIDNFKKINDTYGHQVGDETIIQISNLIKENIRDHDIGARWGGEELAIYLPKVDLEAGYTIAERLVQRVAEQSNPKVTISCGIAAWKKENKETFQSLFHRADYALYIAKESGKNQVIANENKNYDEVKKPTK
ncbi:sensor domain-containing diguanylate cyclase [Ferdinandcohnia quinoae]|uniref:sensor domain-containing diguanylate cyclase n=1 Tax=Fredinandcohnia quinoae TaxID=2918902 RepID=UPI0031F4E5DC